MSKLLKEATLKIVFPNPEELETFLGWLSDGGGESQFMDNSRTYITKFDYSSTENIVEAKVDDSDELSYNAVEYIQELEQRLRMQFCGKGYLDKGHSVMKTPNLGSPSMDKFIVAITSRPTIFPKLEGKPLHKVVVALLELDGLMLWDGEYIIRSYYGDEFYNKHYKGKLPKPSWE